MHNYSFLRACLFVAAAAVLVGISSFQSGAKISLVEARKLALLTIPDGVVQQAELIREKGVLVWSFDINSTTSSNRVQLCVDANTMDVVKLKIKPPQHLAFEGGAGQK